MEVKLDLHIHSEHSPDGRMALDEIVACARARGLQGVAVCDHDRALTETWDAPDFLLIPGIELSTDRGHLLGLFVTEQIEARELDAAIDAVHACGGLAVMAHPFERSSDAQRLDAYLDRTQQHYHAVKRHPSIVAFSLARESANGINLYESYLRLKELEPDRPVIYTESGGEWNSDRLDL